MQELLGRIAALDPDASLGIRVISCFDELILGRVNIPGLLRTAAALAGCPAGFRAAPDAAALRVDPQGQQMPDEEPPGRRELELPDASSVWLERGTSVQNLEPQPHDELILERLSIAVGVRRGVERTELESPRDVALLLDRQSDPELRLQVAARLGIDPKVERAVLAVPLFAVWQDSHRWPSDVITTEHGPVHALILPPGRSAEELRGAVRPAGVGPPAPAPELFRSFELAVIALRLTTPEEPLVAEESYGGLLPLLHTSHSEPTGDDERLSELMEHSWAPAALDAMATASSIRQAAKTANVHHSTMQSHLDTICRVMGFSPLDGYGRTRLSLAHLKWRLRTSTVFSAPPPAR